MSDTTTTTTTTTASWTQQISVTLLVEGAVILVASNAWNNAVQSAIEAVYPYGNAKSIIAKFAYAIVVTIIAVIIVMVIFYSVSEGEQYIQQYMYILDKGQITKQTVLVSKTSPAAEDAAPAASGSIPTTTGFAIPVDATTTTTSSTSVSPSSSSASAATGPPSTQPASKESWRWWGR